MTRATDLAPFCEEFETYKKAASGIVEEVAILAVSETKKTSSFTVRRIGKLVLVRRKDRTGRNRQTGKAIKMPDKTVVRMRVGKAAKEAILPGRK